MNIKEFFKRDNLDEMQKTDPFKTESRGFWALWVLLLAALIIESLQLGLLPRWRWRQNGLSFMLGCAYSISSDLRARYLGPPLQPNTENQCRFVRCGRCCRVCVGALSNLQSLARALRCCRRSSWEVCTWVLCFCIAAAHLQAYKKRHAELENPKEDDDENE